jgi:hypothetical protein
VDRQGYIPGNHTELSLLDALPVFFIVGRGRSGSTLLRSLFDAHPAVMIPMESRFVQFLYYHYPADSHWTPEMAKSAIEALETGFEPLKLHKDALLKQIEALGDRLTLDRVCKLIYLHTQSGFEKEKIQMLGDKNPRYTFFIPQLIRIFPQAKFIHLLRDYRDNIVSVQRAARLIGESGNTYYAMGRWCLYNRFIEKCQKRDPEKFIRLHFEMLIRDPALSMKKLCRFLELEYVPDMLHYQEGIGSYFKQASFRDLHHSLQSPFDVSKIGTWKHVLPRRKVIQLEVLGGRLAESMGYPPEFTVPVVRRLVIRGLFYPRFLMGQFRFYLKILFYRSRTLMRWAYGIILRRT